MKIALACGGTGGHIFPGLATGEALRARGHDVTLWLAGKDVEDTAVRGWSGPVVTVKAEGMPTSASARILSSGLRIARAVKMCTSLMRNEKPDVVLGMGSYASVGPVVAAVRLGIPSVLHESNAVPGRATSLLARWADAVAISFDETRMHLRRRRNLVLTGMPLRRDIEAAARALTPRPDNSPFRLLVMGGSRGARAINEIVPRAAADARGRGAQFEVTHLAGLQNAGSVGSAYAAGGVPHDVRDFVHDMVAVYRECDMVICRAGAASCAEILAMGLPSLLIPYPSAVRDHQTANAVAMERIGAAQMIPERDLTIPWLAGYIADAIAHRERLGRMQAAARANANLDAAGALADLVIRAAEANHVA